MMSIKIEKTFEVPVWDEVTEQKAIDYWTRRRIVFSERSEDTLIGTRGNFLGNLTSFDMSKLMAKLVIRVSNRNQVDCVLVVNTIMQSITEYNREWWKLEMDTFETFLLENDEQEEKWKKFAAVYKSAAWNWTLSFGLKGNRISPEDKS